MCTHIPVEGRDSVQCGRDRQKDVAHDREGEGVGKSEERWVMPRTGGLEVLETKGAVMMWGTLAGSLPTGTLAPGPWLLVCRLPKVHKE